MNSSIKILLMAAGAAAAVALGVTVAFRAKPERQELHAELDALRAAAEEARALRGELADLKASVAEVTRILTSAKAISNSAGAGRSTVPVESQPQARTAEVQINELRDAIDQIRTGMVRRGVLPPGSNEVSSAKAVILGPQAGVVEKLAALRTLRSANARSDDVVRQMVQAYYSTEEPGLRADIFRQLEGVTTPELKPPLLEAVSKAADPGVREEAAETLNSYLPDPEVKAWLEHLATNDPNEQVRKQAAESLRLSSRR